MEDKTNKILVIEDNFDVRENLVEILELAGYDVVEAENGIEGVRKAKQYRPDLILCDVMMPELDGYGVLRILGRNPDTSDIPLVFLTAKAEKSDFRKGMNLGAVDYITKPFDDVELLDAIQVRMEKSKKISHSFDGTLQGLNTFVNEAKGKEAMEALKGDNEIRKYKRKDIVYSEGDFGRYLYFIVSGKVKIFKTNDWGKEYIIDVLDEGSFFGYSDLIREASRQESVAAIEAAELCLIPKEDFFTLLYSNRDFSAAFIKMLVHDNASTEGQLLGLAYDSIRKRVANALLRLDDRFQEEGISIMRDDLAAMIGTAKETAIRTLTDFKGEGLIEIESGRIKILNRKKLEQLNA